MDRQEKGICGGQHLLHCRVTVHGQTTSRVLGSEGCCHPIYHGDGGGVRFKGVRLNIGVPGLIKIPLVKMSTDKHAGWTMRGSMRRGMGRYQQGRRKASVP